MTTNFSFRKKQKDGTKGTLVEMGINILDSSEHFQMII